MSSGSGKPVNCELLGLRHSWDRIPGYKICRRCYKVEMTFGETFMVTPPNYNKNDKDYGKNT